MTEPEGKPTLLQGALRGMVKLIKAVQYYPPAHPTLKEAVAEALQGFSPLLAGESSFSFTIRRDGFFLGDSPVGPQNPILKKLAPFLFARRIQTLLLLSDLSGEDLRAFARCLTFEPGELQKLGGIQDVLLKARVSTLWVNEFNLSEILARKEEIEAEKAAHPGEGDQAEEDAAAAGETEAVEPTPEERNLARVVQELQQETVDQRYRVLIQELVPLIHLNLTETSRPLILTALTMLGRHAGDEHANPARREYALQALSQLAAEDVLDFLMSILCAQAADGEHRDQEEQERQQILEILVSLQGKVVIWRLMDHLAVESDSRVRKTLSEALIRQGQSAIPVLVDYLADERWFVVRNTVAILGDIREPEAAGYLRGLLRHKDLRVRRETIRALTKIGGQSAVGILLRTVEEADPDLRRQALLSLGAMKNPAAVPTLLRLVTQPDPMLKKIDIRKEAAKALGEIGSSEATPALVAILRHRRFWRRSTYDELRAVAAQALGEIRDPEAIPVLEKAAEDHSNSVARTAAQALKQMKRGEEHGPGTA